MSTWHDRVGDLTLFETLMGGTFEHQNWQHRLEFDQKFSKKSNAPGGGGMGSFGIDRYIISLIKKNRVLLARISLPLCRPCLCEFVLVFAVINMQDF